MGQKVAEGTTSGTILVAELAKGAYLLQTKVNELLTTTKFIVK